MTVAIGTLMAFNSLSQAGCNKEDGTIVKEFDDYPTSEYTKATLSPKSGTTRVYLPVQNGDSVVLGQVKVTPEHLMNPPKEGCVNNEIVWRIDGYAKLTETSAYYLTSMPVRWNFKNYAGTRSSANYNKTKKHEEAHQVINKEYIDYCKNYFFADLESKTFDDEEKATSYYESKTEIFEMFKIDFILRQTDHLDSRFDGTNPGHLSFNVADLLIIEQNWQ